MTPTANNILLKEIKKELKTESGIILTADVSTGNIPAYVEAVGLEVKEVQVGDTVYCDWKKAIPVTVDGAQAVLLSEEAVYGYVRGTK